MESKEKVLKHSSPFSTLFRGEREMKKEQMVVGLLVLEKDSQNSGRGKRRYVRSGNTKKRCSGNDVQKRKESLAVKLPLLPEIRKDFPARGRVLLSFEKKSIRIIKYNNGKIEFLN